MNSQLTFRLGNDKLPKPTIDITLPYASFDLVPKSLLRPNVTSYFPLSEVPTIRLRLAERLCRKRIRLVSVREEICRPKKCSYIITNYD